MKVFLNVRVVWTGATFIARTEYGPGFVAMLRQPLPPVSRVGVPGSSIDETTPAVFDDLMRIVSEHIFVRLTDAVAVELAENEPVFPVVQDEAGDLAEEHEAAGEESSDQEVRHAVKYERQVHPRRFLG
jgi:hypothetical protein